MYTTFTVKDGPLNGLTIEPLARVNLIAGKNNVGKTALLEAILGKARDGEDIFDILIGSGVGANRLDEIIAIIARSEDCLVLIDGAIDAFHYTALEDTWRVIDSLSQEYDVQVFATTHSLECIRAAYKVFGENPGDDFKYHRLDSRDGVIVATTYDDEGMAGVIEFDGEPR